MKFPEIPQEHNASLNAQPRLFLAITHHQHEHRSQEYHSQPVQLTERTTFPNSSHCIFLCQSLYCITSSDTSFNYHILHPLTYFSLPLSLPLIPAASSSPPPQPSLNAPAISETTHSSHSRAPDHERPLLFLVSQSWVHLCLDDDHCRDL